MADINEELLRALNGPAPQHKKYGEQAFEFTEGEQGKLFTGNHVMTDSGLWIPQKGSDDGAAHTQLSWSIGEELVFDDYSIRDTNNHSVDFDLSKYKNFSIFGYSTHDTDIQLRFRFPTRRTLGYTEAMLDDEGNRKEVLRPVLQPYYNYLISSGPLDFLNRMKTTRLQFNLTVAGDEAPESGSVNILVIGEIYK